MKICPLCESPARRLFRMNTVSLCAWCMKAIAEALVHREETRP